MPIRKDRAITEDGIRLTKLPILGYSWYWGGLGYWIRSAWVVGVWLIPMGAGAYVLSYYTNWAFTSSDVPVPPRIALLVLLWILTIGGSIWAWQDRKAFTSVDVPSEDNRRHLKEASLQAAPQVSPLLPFLASLLIVPSVLLMYRAWKWRRTIVPYLRTEAEKEKSRKLAEPSQE